MSIEKLVITCVGVGLIFVIRWFFFGKKNANDSGGLVKKDIKGNPSVDIVVDGGYKPAVIFLEVGKKTNLKIIRRDQNTCLSDIILPDFKLSRYLPINKEVQIEINPDKAGEYPFHCGMNMYHGKLVVN